LGWFRRSIRILKLNSTPGQDAALRQVANLSQAVFCSFSEKFQDNKQDDKHPYAAPHNEGANGGPTGSGYGEH
jgi:hypothetical protein